MQHIFNAQLSISIPAVIVIVLTTIGFLFAGDTAETRNPVELKVRNGLPNFFNRVNKGEVIRIAYLGGSITEADEGWRDQTLQYFQSEYSRSTITQINAGIGGTGSDLGVFRLQSHVLDYDPHLVFIEFACNDIKKPAQVIIRSMEGLVRKIRKHNPTIEVCFVYTLSDVMVEQLSKDTYPAVVMTMEKVAEHYQIPSIYMGLEIVKLASRGELMISGTREEYPDKVVFSSDGVHPYPETGHVYYTEATKRSFKRLAARDRPVNYKLSEPINKDNWETAHIIPVKKIKLHGEWKIVEPGNRETLEKFKNLFDTVYVANVPGASFTVKFRGTRIGLQDIIGPTSGQYNVEIDAERELVVPRFDSYCFFYRSHYFLLDQLLDGEHSVTFSLSPQKLNKASILAQHEIKIDKKHIYDEQEVVLGNILLLGEFIEQDD